MVGPTIDSDFQRLFAKVKYMVVRKNVTDPMAMLTNLVGGSGAIEKANKDAAIWLTIQLERALFRGNESVNPYEFNGLSAAAASAHSSANPHVFDMRGKPLTGNMAHDVIATLIDPPNWGNPTHLICSVRTRTDMAKLAGPHIRYNIPTGPGGAKGGFVVQGQAIGIEGPRNFVPFNINVFLAAEGGPPAGAVGESGQAPATPVITPATTLNSASLFTAAEYGTYQYQARANGAKAASAPCAVEAVVVDASNNRVALPITAPSTDDVLWYDIYRSKPGGTVMYKIGRIGQARDGSGAPIETTYVDMNENLPGTQRAYVVEMRPEVFQWKQLLDFARVPLAKVELAQPFAYVLYGMPVFYVPTKLAEIINIGYLEED